MEPDRSPAQLIAESEGLLLDFDGPVCDVYAGSDPARIARDVAAAFGLDVDTDDPLDLITHALATDGPVDAIHDALAETEITAVRSANETLGVRNLLASYLGPVAVVSNNSAKAIHQWLARTGLREDVDVIIGRNPRHMKPDPWGLVSAADAVGLAVTACVFIGDSLSDAHAAERAQSQFVPYANNASKGKTFRQHGWFQVVDDLNTVVHRG